MAHGNYGQSVNLGQFGFGAALALDGHRQYCPLVKGKTIWFDMGLDAYLCCLDRNLPAGKQEGKQQEGQAWSLDG